MTADAAIETLVARQERQRRADAIRDAGLALWVEQEVQSPGSDAAEIAHRLALAGLIEVTEAGGRFRVTMLGRTAVAPGLRAALRLWVREMRT